MSNNSYGSQDQEIPYPRGEKPAGNEDFGVLRQQDGHIPNSSDRNCHYPNSDSEGYSDD